MCHKTSGNTHKVVRVYLSREVRKGEKGTWKKEEKEKDRSVARSLMFCK